MNKDEILKLIKAQRLILSTTIKHFISAGGDVSTLTVCGPREVWSEALQKCVPDIGDGDPDPNGK